MLGREDGVMVKKYRVWPAEEEQQELRAPASRGRAAAYRRTHARIPRFHGGRLCFCAMNTSPAAP